MLSCDQLAALAGAICATAETLGQTLSANAAKLMAEDLSDYSPLAIRDALQACRRELTGKLTLAAILQRVQAADGRPEPNEAWSLALSATNEFDSVVLTDEIQLALGAARAVLDAGDKIGARMAFLSAYQRFVDAARREVKPVCWKLSPGFDPAGRLIAVEEAGRLGRLPAHVVREHIAQLTHQPITQDGKAIAALLTGNVVEMSAGLRGKWRSVRDELSATNALREEVRKAEREAHAEDLERRKLAVLSAVAAKSSEAGA